MTRTLTHTGTGRAALLAVGVVLTAHVGAPLLAAAVAAVLGVRAYRRLRSWRPSTGIGACAGLALVCTLGAT